MLMESGTNNNMENDIISLVYVCIHIASITFFLKNWKARAILHPGFIFAILWLVSTISEWLALRYDIVSLPNELAIYELNMYAAFTSLVFVCFSFVGKSTEKKIDTFRIAGLNMTYINYLLWFALISTFFTWIINGASFDFSSNRSDIIDYQSHMSHNYTILDTLLALCNTAMPFVTIVIGYYLGIYLATGEAKVNKKWFYLPLIIAFVEAMTQGGRVSVLMSLRSYLLGIGFSLPLFSISKNRRRKIIAGSLAVLVLFLIFISVIGQSRATFTGNDYIYSRFGIFAGVVDYMTSHYWGYQLRRLDYADGINLYYGVNTFYGLLDFRIPFSSALGLPGNIWSIFGVDFDPLKIYKSGVEGCYTTSSQFMPLIADFGTRGCFIAIIFLVGITHKLFINLISVPKKSAFGIILFYMVYCYWFGSNFNNGFMSLYTVLISALVFELSKRSCNAKE